MNITPLSCFPQNTAKRNAQSAFTVVELLVVSAIVAAVLGLGGAALSAVGKSGDLAREIAAGRTLITAYTAHSADNGNRAMIAFDERPVKVWYQPDQVEVGGGGGLFERTVFRYPFRLAPYFNFTMDGVILGKKNKALAEEAAKGGGRNMWYYTVSASPSFGINETFVGGKVSLLAPRARPGEFGDYGYTELSRRNALTRLVERPRIIVFASAAINDASGKVSIGNYKVDSPTAGGWSNREWKNADNPSEFGSIHARFNGKALAVFLDGSVEALTIDELRDMRLWSKAAIDEGNPNYLP